MLRWLALLVTIAPFAIGCSPPCQTADSAPVPYNDGHLVDAWNYESTAWTDSWLHFPGGRHYRFFHMLGSVPVGYSTFLGFSEHPVADHNSAESAGNQAQLATINDQYLELYNDTCSDFWIRVVAWSAHGDGGIPSDGGSDAASDAPSD